MKKFYHFLLLCCVILSFAACSSGHKAYKRGDYFKASFDAIEHLRTSPRSEKSQYVLLKSYPLAQKTALREIDNATLTNEPNKYDILVYQYERLTQLANSIYNCPKAYELIPNPAEYRAELGDAKRMAAESAYGRGLTALDVGTVEQARVAYNYFQAANKYVYGYSDVLLKIENARYYSTYRILVQKPVTSSKYQYSADFFYNNLLSELIKSTGNRFIRFYTHEEAYRENMRDPHQYIEIDFQNFTVGNIRETSNTTDHKRDSVIVGTVKVEGKSYNSYATVNAKLTTYRREILSGGVLNVSIIDALSNRTLQQRNFAGEFVWRTIWSNYKGDDRALTEEQKQLCDRKPEIPPSQQDMFVEFTKPIYDQALPYLRSFYSKY
jgi:hypothetical protein